MPKAATHDRITVISAAALAPLLYHAGHELTRFGLPLDALTAGDVLLFVAAHLVSGYYFSPDLDTDSRIHRRWGPLGVIWLPYRCMVPHRHFWSHSLVVAPLLRLVYLFAVIHVLLFAVHLLQIFSILADFPLPTVDPQLGLVLLQQYPRESLLVLAGFISGSAAHSISDWLVTMARRRSR